MKERTFDLSKIKEEINRRGGDGDAVAEAYHDYYNFHEIRICEWLARLFDPDIGGFYYSNSGRDNDILVRWDGVTCKGLPDIESTYQALSFMKQTGMIRDYSEIPLWMREKIRDFVCSLEDPEDGFFYHPQWGKQIANARRGRDLDWGVAIPSMLGFELPYPTAYDRIKAAKAEKSDSAQRSAALPEHLESREKFIKYLEGLDWYATEGVGAYGAGNTLAAEIKTIIAAGLSDVACDFLDSIQNKETGIWGVQGGYAGVNAILKVANVYAWAKRPIPNPEIVARTSMEAITTPEDNRTVCYQFNAWWSVDIVRRNTLKLLGADGEAVVRRIDAEMLPRAASGIRATIEKITPFKCDDGSYSYFKHCTCPTSQSALVAMEVKEGDINATTINCQGVLLRSIDALGLTGLQPEIFGPAGYDVFLSALKTPTK